MSWFEKLTRCEERSAEEVRRFLRVESGRLYSQVNGQSWRCGELEMPTLGQLRKRVEEIKREKKPNSISEVVADVQQLHGDPRNEQALFQVASQFNLLEMTSPNVTPEQGIGIYEHDHTQGPACAIAAGAGTIFRHYFVNMDGQIGQTAKHQIDCLAGVGKLLGNVDNALWRMVNGYALPSAPGLRQINQLIAERDEKGQDEIRQALQIGLQWNAQVTLDNNHHLVSQAYCSAMPVSYSKLDNDLWAPFATLILEAAYEATICAAIINQARTGCNRLFLTLLGGGVFGNDSRWIMDAIRRSLEIYADSGLEISVVSYGKSNHQVQALIREW